MGEIFSKCIISGDLYEFYEFSTPVKTGSRKSAEIREDSLTDSEKMENRKRSLIRTKKNIKRYLHCNDDLLYFWTLTFKDNVKDVDCANRLFKQFIQRLRYVYPDIKYLSVVEYQKRGAVHYHIIVDEWVSFDFMSSLWNNGYVLVKKVNDRRHLVNYLLKYFTKISSTDKRLWNKKIFFRSRNLTMPEEYNNMSVVDFSTIVKNKMIENWKGSYKFKCRIGSFDSDFIGRINFWIYDLSIH